MQYRPAGQGKQSDTLPAPDTFLNVPAGQSTGLIAFSPQYLPGGQAVQLSGENPPTPGL